MFIFAIMAFHFVIQMALLVGPVAAVPQYGYPAPASSTTSSSTAAAYSSISTSTAASLASAGLPITTSKPSSTFSCDDNYCEDGTS